MRFRTFYEVIKVKGKELQTLAHFSHFWGFIFILTPEFWLLAPE